MSLASGREPATRDGGEESQEIMTDTPTKSPEAPREGSLEAPFRHPLAWRDPDFYDLLFFRSQIQHYWVTAPHFTVYRDNSICRFQCQF